MRKAARNAISSLALWLGIAGGVQAQPNTAPYPTPTSFAAFLIADPLDEIAGRR